MPTDEESPTGISAERLAMVIQKQKAWPRKANEPASSAEFAIDSSLLTYGIDDKGEAAFAIMELNENLQDATYQAALREALGLKDDSKPFEVSMRKSGRTLEGVQVCLQETPHKKTGPKARRIEESETPDIALDLPAKHVGKGVKGKEGKGKDNPKITLH